MSEIITKKCSKCRKELEKITENFYYNKRLKRWDSWCRKCTNIGVAKRHKETNHSSRWYAAHPEVKKRLNKEYYQNNKEKCNQYSKEYIKLHPEKKKKINKKYNESHKKERLELQRKWQNNNREKIRGYCRDRRARRQFKMGHISKDEWIKLLRFYENKCLCCKRDDVKLTLDHVIPLSKGGEHSIKNVQPLCQKCNSSKGTKIIDYRLEFK